MVRDTYLRVLRQPGKRPASRRTKLTIDTTPANARNRDSDDVFSAIFNSNDRTPNNQSVERTLPG